MDGYFLPTGGGGVVVVKRRAQKSGAYLAELENLTVYWLAEKLEGRQGKCGNKAEERKRDTCIREA